ncbi:oligosaccharide flippase family protein [Neolewinella lacunae]|uniref:Polysaccharide biosynthesis C-terminal domain-containing protein n=1 Tax=Neolewinella lacunae TaxID=1517758 RepID=A0A923TA34_9BACT|nr:oligosaccharide flippase family protein [Neolewinella lacunae]MBC6995728.1 polysaccharide biosynthesis C-terminal domain-containing protein [Neolewinella lacunae]MDN3636579.1 oligosaccharide flippase family protein [Neolewinella lacunae]
MVGQFFRNALFQVSLNVLVKGVYLFGVERVVQNTLPAGDYGLYFSLLGLGMLFQVIADFGLQLYNSRELSGHRHLLGKYFPYFLGTKLLLGLVFFVLLLGAGWWLGYRGAELTLLVLAGLAQFANSLVLYLRSNLAGMGRFALDGWFSILDKVLLIATVGGLLWFAPAELTVLRFAALQFLSWGLTALLLFLALRQRLPRRLPRFRWPTVLLLLLRGGPFALSVFLVVAYTKLDGVMIERLLPDGATAASHYAAAYRLLDALNIFGWLLAGLLLPMYARLYARGESLLPLLRFSVQLLLAGGLCAAIPLATYRHEIVGALYHFAEPRTGHILLFLAGSFVAQCLNYAYGSLLSATGYIGQMNGIFTLGIVLNLAGNWWAIHHYGAPGAAAVTFLTQAFVAALQAVLAHRWLGLPGTAVAWWRLALLLSVLLVGAAVLRWPAMAPVWWLGLPVLAMLGAAATLLLGLVDLRRLRELGADAGARAVAKSSDGK